MNKGRNEATVRLEVEVKGSLVENGVIISKKQDLQELSSRGYGVAENKELLLTFYEALYLSDKRILEVEDENGRKVDFQQLLQRFKNVDENAWVKYLTYRDLRSRGYVVREGFGFGVDFRVYDRGEYGAQAAKHLVLSMQEGKPISTEHLNRVLRSSQSLKKKLIVAVMNRRGEAVYYSVAQLTLK
jgi:tRNA-intron endonuclease